MASTSSLMLSWITRDVNLCYRVVGAVDTQPPPHTHDKGHYHA